MTLGTASSPLRPSVSSALGCPSTSNLYDVEVALGRGGRPFQSICHTGIMDSQKQGPAQRVLEVGRAASSFSGSLGWLTGLS